MRLAVLALAVLPMLGACKMAKQQQSSVKGLTDAAGGLSVENARTFVANLLGQFHAIGTPGGPDRVLAVAAEFWNPTATFRNTNPDVRASSSLTGPDRVEEAFGELGAYFSFANNSAPLGRGCTYAPTNALVDDTTFIGGNTPSFTFTGSATLLGSNPQANGTYSDVVTLAPAGNATSRNLGWQIATHVATVTFTTPIADIRTACGATATGTGTPTDDQAQVGNP